MAICAVAAPTSAAASATARPKWAGFNGISGLAYEDTGNVVRAAGGFCGIDQMPAALFEGCTVAAGLKDTFHLRRVHHAVQAVAADQDQGALLERNRITIDGQRAARSDRHGEDVPHRVVAEAFFIQAQGASDLIHPRLVIGDSAEARVVQEVCAAVADAGDGQSVVRFQCGYDGGAHAFQAFVRLCSLDDAAVSLFDGGEENLRVPPLCEEDGFG